MGTTFVCFQGVLNVVKKFWWKHKLLFVSWNVFGLKIMASHTIPCETWTKMKYFEKVVPLYQGISCFLEVLKWACLCSCTVIMWKNLRVLQILFYERTWPWWKSVYDLFPYRVWSDPGFHWSCLDWVLFWISRQVRFI